VPIYEYRCSACAFQKEYLQKVNAPLLSVCPECGQETFGKMLTAAGFQLKGGGWYATDFKNSGAAPTAKTAGQSEPAAKAEGKTETASDSKSEAKSDSKSEAKSDSKTIAQPAAVTAPASAASTARAE
jgi:putative FmdB family regulatory protein